MNVKLLLNLELSRLTKARKCILGWCGWKTTTPRMHPYYSAFSTEQEPSSLASKKIWLTLWVHSVTEIPPSMDGLKTCGTAPTTAL